MEDQFHLSIVIVTWNVRAPVLDCLYSVFTDLAQTRAIADVWVVDNNSQDGTAEAIREAFPEREYPALRLLETGENLGFAGGNNHALRVMGFPDGDRVLPDYVLLLNPDTVVTPGAFQALLDGMQQTGAGLGGASLVYGDGSFQHGTFAFPGLAQLVIDLFPVPGRVYESRLNGRYPRSWYEAGQPFAVGHPLGAVFMLRREAIRQTGLFDEQFHLYCEEIDWALRIHQAGWPVMCIPSAKVIHLAGQSTSQVRPQSIINLWTARLRLFRKHYSPLKRMLARQIIRAGVDWQIRRTARDSSRPEEERAALVSAYRAVVEATRRI